MSYNHVCVQIISFAEVMISEHLATFSALKYGIKLKFFNEMILFNSIVIYISFEVTTHEYTDESDDSAKPFKCHHGEGKFGLFCFVAPLSLLSNFDK